MIFDEKKHAREMIAEGGEGRIYSIGSGKIIKIFKNSANKREKKAKIELLLGRKLPETVVAPIEIVENPSGNFSGYEMQAVSGDEMRVLSSVKFVRANRINKKDIVSMLVQVKNTLKSLHSQDIYVGDLNDSNILFDHQYNIHFIDVDSWSVPPYRCNVVMDTFRDPHLVGDEFNASTDAYAFAILAYKLMTRLHPFGGTMRGGQDVDIVSRMKSRASVIDNKDVIIPIIVEKDSFMPRKMIASFKDIFDGDQRFLIDDLLDDFQDKMTLCPNHGDYYYNNYTSCPVCSKVAIDVSNPIVVASVGGARCRMLLSIKGAIVIDENCYIFKNLVRFRNSKMTIPYNRGVRYYANDIGDVIFEVYTDRIVINRASGIKTTVPTKYNSPAVVRGDSIYFISPGLAMTRLRPLGNEIAEESIETVAFNSFFNVIDSKNYLIYNLYEKEHIIDVSGRHIEIPDRDNVKNVAARFDTMTRKWLVVESSELTSRTMIIDIERGIIYNNGAMKYPCNPSHVEYNNDFIYIPSDGEISRLNPMTGERKEFKVEGVSTGTHLRKEGAKFIATDSYSIQEIG